MKIRKAFKRFGLPRRNIDFRYILAIQNREDLAIQDGTLIQEHPDYEECITQFLAPQYNHTRAARIRIGQWLRRYRKP